MAHILSEGFDSVGHSEAVRRWMEKEDKRLAKASSERPLGDLEKMLIYGTVRAIQTGVDQRCATSLLGPGAGFDMIPVEGDPKTWTVTVIPYPDTEIRTVVDGKLVEGR